MLDLRAYRAAFLPAVAVVFLAAFSLTDRPEPLRAPGTVAFDAERAFGVQRGPARSSLRELADTFPLRRPGSAGDSALADRVAEDLGAGGFTVSRHAAPAMTAEGEVDLETVVGVRPGRVSRRVVVLAHRDSLSSPAMAELSATAALLELARGAGARNLERTLVLVSTSGGSAGAGGARDWARRAAGSGDVDAVLVLGDLASDAVHKPWVVPWSNAGRPAPAGLRRTVETAVRVEVGADPGGPRAAGQWVRRAVPLSLGEQGEINAAGLPAVLLSVSGERPPPSDARVSTERFSEFGRATVHALSALDVAAGRNPFADESDGIVTLRRHLPSWIVRLLVGVLLLPAFVIAFDAFFRVRRRGQPSERWLGWAALCGTPVLLAWAWTRALGAVGALKAPRGPAPAGAIEVAGSGIAVVASAALLLVLAGVALRVLGLRALGLRGRPRASGGAAAGAGLLLSVTALALWMVNPWAAGLLVPAVHLWLLAATPESTWSRVATVIAMTAGAALPALAVLHYGLAFSMDPFQLGWLLVLAVGAGEIGPLDAAVVALVIGCLIALVGAAGARLRLAAANLADPDAMVTRGPSGYAGPGSLGGTESALRR